MSFYLGHKVKAANDRKVVSRQLLDKGLELFKAKPCEVQVTVIASTVQPGYASYVQNLSPFIYATLTQKRVVIRNRGYVLPTPPHLIPFALPPCVVDFEKPLTERQVESLPGSCRPITGKTTNSTYVMQEPTPTHCKNMVALGARSTTPAFFGVVNLEAMKIYFVLVKLFSGFLLTHTYPAFRHMEDINPTTVPISQMSKRRRADDGSYLACISQQQCNSDVEDDDAMADADGAEPPAADVPAVNLCAARPQAIEDNKWGSVEDIPNASGLFVPYVRDLAVADESTVIDLISTHFVRSLADNIEGMCKTMNKIKSAWGHIIGTDSGHEMSHLAKCIDIALRGQAAVYPVFSASVYEGCVIYGAGYNIGVHDEVLRPIAYADLQLVVASKSMHGRSLAKIVELVDDDDLEDDIVSCTTMRALSNLLKRFAMDEADRAGVISAASSLCYRGKYWSTSPYNVNKALPYLVDTTLNIPEDVPLHPSYIFSCDRVELVLSAFGHQGPTFMIPNGAKCNLTGDKPPVTFVVRTIALTAAIADMRSMMELGYITNNMNNLSRVHQDVAVKPPMKTLVWKQLIDVYETAKKTQTDSKPAAKEIVTGATALDGDWD